MAASSIPPGGGELLAEASKSGVQPTPFLDTWVESAKSTEGLEGGCTFISKSETAWLDKELARLQSDSISKWLVKRPKGPMQKLPRRDRNGTLVLKRWYCNAANKCGCLAEVKLVRSESGGLVLLTKGSHAHVEVEHDQRPLVGLPHNIKVALLNFLDSDISVPKIIHHLELSGFQLDGIKKKQIKNFLSYKRRTCTPPNTIAELERFIMNNLWAREKAYDLHDCFIIDHEFSRQDCEETRLNKFMASFSTPQMVEWANKSIAAGKPRQMTIDATFRIFTNDTFVLLASGITNDGTHWFPLVYSIVPCESMETTTFHLQSLWKLLGTNASNFFDHIYVLKDAGAGLHAGVQNFFSLQGHTWHQQDCYAHLSRVDGNLQQAFKRYHIPISVGTLIASYIKRISYAPCKATREILLNKFENEFSKYDRFIHWWKSTYGGPFKHWARCDAPTGYPVSNQGHESNNNTFKRVHMPSRATQRRMDLHKALVPLTRAISSLVREKVREYEFLTRDDSSIQLRLWEDVHHFMLCSDWMLRQKVEDYTLFPSKKKIDDALVIARERAYQVVKELLVHSNEGTREIVEEVDLQLQNVLLEEAENLLHEGLQPLKEECMEAFFARTSKWIVLRNNCSCYTFQDKGVCKHILAVRIDNGELQIPASAQVLHYSKIEQLKLQHQRERTHKQKARAANNSLRLKRLKAGLEDLLPADSTPIQGPPTA